MIKNFKEFLKESYLEGGRQPLYHFTNRLNLIKIIESDALKTSRPSRQSHNSDKSISLTRSKYYSNDGSGFSVAIQLDYDKLLRDGYVSYPVDEWAWEDGEPNTSAIKKYNFNKSNFKAIKAGKRGTKHGLDNLPTSFVLETEFEERIYKNIKEIGKYIISIYINNLRNNLRNNNIEDYLMKYPNIKILLFDGELDNNEDVTKSFKNTKVKKHQII